MAEPRGVAARSGRWWLAVGVALLLAWLWSYAGTAYLDRGRLLLIAGDPADVADCLGGGNRMDPDDQAKVAVLLSTRAGWYMLQRELHHPAYEYWQRGWTDWLMVGHVRLTSGGVVWQSAIPLWTLTLPIAAGWAVTAAVGRRTAQRAAAGQCVQCGYDLRGSPGRCPECGTVPAPQ